MDGCLLPIISLSLLALLIIHHEGTKVKKHKSIKRAEVRDADGILSVGNHVNDPRYRLTDENGCIVDHVDVYLPSGMDYEDKLYALYLINHPRSDVTVHFTEEELWKQ